MSVHSENKDYLKIQFLNTHQFMIDEQGQSINILPSGYTVLHELPRMKQKGSLIVEEKEKILQSSQSILTAVPVLGFIFNLSMQQLWGSINSM